MNQIKEGFVPKGWRKWGRWLLFKSFKKVHTLVPRRTREKYRSVYRKYFFDRLFPERESLEQYFAFAPRPLPPGLWSAAKQIESLPLEISLITNFECVYNCTYCFALKPKNKSEYRKHDGKEWQEALRSLHEKYGKCRLVLSGGEPLYYRDAIDFVINTTKWHDVLLGTNLFIPREDVRRIAIEANKENLFVSASFHLERAIMDEFLDKILLFNELGVNSYVSVVAYPKYLDKMLGIKKTFEENSIPIGFFPYIGDYEGRHFPDEYLQGELDILWTLPGWHWQKPGTKIQLPRTRGVFCFAGVRTISINPSGDVRRCLPVDHVLGNVFDKSFSLLRGPLPCPAQVCNCELYWKYHLK